MKRQRFLVIFVLSLVLGILFSTATIYAQAPSPAVIESFTIENIDGSDVTNGPLMAGATYTVSLEINVGVDLAKNKLILATSMQKVEDVYWHLENGYLGIDTETWQPGRSTIEFDTVKGIAQLTLKGSVSSDYTSERLPNDDYIHLIKPIPLVTLSLGPDGTLLDEYSVEVVDQAIVSYQQALIEKSSLLQTADADPKYEELVAEVIALAEGLSSKGYVQNAIDLLDTIPGSASDFPIPVSENSSLPYLAAIIVLAILQQITGINIVIYYAPKIFLKAGFESDSTAFFASVIVGIVNFSATIVALWIIDKVGRKPLLLYGTIGMGISLLLAGLAFHAQIGGFAILIPILSYILFFAIGQGPVVWVLISEIFPTKIRGRAMSIAIMALWISCFAVSQTFPWLLETFEEGAFYLYAGICVVTVIFVWRFVIETKGKTLEEIEKLWKV